MTSAWQRRLEAGKPVASARQNGSAVTGSPKEKLPQSVKRYVGARRSGGRLLPSMERYLLTVEDERGGENLLHVSDLTKNVWCPRMLYYRVNGVRPQIESVHFQLQNIYDYGTETHLKFQRRWREMGVLWGRWACLECEKSWRGMSPEECPRCHIRNAIMYAEVPLARRELFLVGNADGEVRDADGNVLVEIKTMAEGTFRMEVPKLLGQYTRMVTLEDGKAEKQVDIKQLWSDMRRPLPSHSRQGQTYVELRKGMLDQPPVDGIVYLYEHKGNQGLKEFVVQPDPTIAEEVLGRAANVVWSLNRNQAPRCLEGRDGCKLCQPYEEEFKRGNGGKAVVTPQVQPRRRPVYSGSERV